MYETTGIPREARLDAIASASPCRLAVRLASLTRQPVRRDCPLSANVGEVINLPALRGYLLEEVLAWLLKTSGYELLAVGDDSPDVLGQTNHGLVVRGRGAWHQADALGEFRHVPPFPCRSGCSWRRSSPALRSVWAWCATVTESCTMSMRTSSPRPGRPLVARTGRGLATGTTTRSSLPGALAGRPRSTPLHIRSR